MRDLNDKWSLSIAHSRDHIEIVAAKNLRGDRNRQTEDLREKNRLDYREFYEPKMPLFRCSFLHVRAFSAQSYAQQ